MANNPVIPKHEVFLSFRGEDTRNNFVSHLSEALERKGIKFYMDEKSLERGHEISYSLQQAIRESKASIVVFSENYASSRWCLEELVHIMECKERHGQIVVPVFYHVEPTHVRKQQDRFGEAFSEMIRERFADDAEKVNKWRAALKMASDLSGWHIDIISPEAKKVEDIVKDVKNKLKKIPHSSDHDFKGLVGMEKHMDQIQTLLCLSNRDVVRAIAIWGMGGIGKTTLATAVFKKFFFEFEGRCCFLENVREKWANQSEREKLKQELHSKILGEQEPYNAEERLRQKKVLIVLDDIDDVNQLQLLGDDYCSGFGRGSRIILTTRNKEMLRCLEADDIETELYEVDKLKDSEALQLFNSMAFKGQSAKADQYIEISTKVVQNYAKGIPLALVVFGSFLRRKRKEEWENYLDQLKEEPNDQIRNVLKVSYDGLHETDQRVFLDVACFLKGKDIDSAEEILHSCYDNPHFSAKTRISNLIESALITIGETGILLMHDLLQEMGWEIVNSSNIDPGKRSRLWDDQVVCDVLKNKSGTETIEGIRVYLHKVEFGPLAFEGMHNLRFLDIIENSDGFPKAAFERIPDLHILNITENSDGFPKATFRQGLQYLPNALRYLHWRGCNLEYFPLDFNPQNLVELNMISCQLKHLWNGVQNLANLKHITLSQCNKLTRIPDLSCAPKLQSISLLLCRSLIEVPSLNFQVFENPNSQKKFRKDLGTLSIKSCRRLNCIPNISGNVKMLDLTASGIIALPSSIKDLSRLIELRVTYCRKLKALPQLPLSLRLLDAAGCKSLETVATSLSEITHAHWKDYHVTNSEKFQFSGCPKMDQDSRQSLMNESHIRVLRTAILSTSKAEEISALLKDHKPIVEMCIPGNEVPKWFRYKSEKSSITIKLQPNWHVNFIGFALCAIVTDCFNYIREWESTIHCTYSFKTSDDYDVEHSSRGSLKFNNFNEYKWRNWSKIGIITRAFRNEVGRNDQFIWYLHEDHYLEDYRDAFEISFQFMASMSNYCTCQRCGVHLLYRQEAEELGINCNGMNLGQKEE